MKPTPSLVFETFTKKGQNYNGQESMNVKVS